MSITNNLIVATMFIVGITLVVIPAAYPDKYIQQIERIVKWIKI